MKNLKRFAFAGLFSLISSCVSGNLEGDKSYLYGRFSFAGNDYSRLSKLGDRLLIKSNDKYVGASSYVDNGMYRAELYLDEISPNLDDFYFKAYDSSENRFLDAKIMGNKKIDLSPGSVSRIDIQGIINMPEPLTLGLFGLGGLGLFFRKRKDN